MSEPKVLLDKDGRVATVTLNDPDRRNPMSDPEMIEAIVAAVTDVQNDTSIACMILTGAGSAFCAGGDV